MNTFTYKEPIPLHYCGLRSEVNMGKILFKFPMDQSVFTSNYERWAYRFEERGIMWYRVSSIAKEFDSN